MSLVDEPRRDLTVRQPLDRDRQLFVGRRSDRVAALRLVPVLGGQADVEVLAGLVSAPAAGVEQERSNPRRLVDLRGHLGDEPRKAGLAEWSLCHRAALLERCQCPRLRQ
jgi:hypothetical protein